VPHATRKRAGSRGLSTRHLLAPSSFHLLSRACRCTCAFELSNLGDGVLAGLAVIGALTVALVWEWCAIRRTLARNRRLTPEEAFWREHRALNEPR
jgi:hypothetical protein